MERPGWCKHMEDVRGIIARNIADLRRMHKMTQLELAEKLNYSDKTISKWERGESSPDIAVMIEIARLFGVSLDYLVSEDHSEEAEPTPIIREARYNRRAIAYVSESVGWLVAIFAFIITTLIIGRMSFQFLYFVYALPVFLIVTLILNSIWFNPRRNYLIVSLLMWAILAAVHITFLYFGINVALVYLLGVAGQVVIVLWSFISKPKIKQE